MTEFNTKNSPKRFTLSEYSKAMSAFNLAQDNLECAVEEILGMEIEEMHFDLYDSSIEIFNVEFDRCSQEQMNKLSKLGFEKVWVHNGERAEKYFDIKGFDHERS